MLDALLKMMASAGPMTSKDGLFNLASWLDAGTNVYRLKDGTDESQIVASQNSEFGKRKAAHDEVSGAKKPALAAEKPEVQSVGDINVLPLAGMAFIRTGLHQYPKAVCEFVVSLGGTWVKKADHATAAIDGGAEIMHTKNWSKEVIKLLEQGKPVVPVDTNLHEHTPAAVQQFLQALQAANQLVARHIKAGATPADIAEAYRKAFPSVKTGVKQLGFPYPETAARYYGGECTDHPQLPCNTTCVLTQQDSRGLKFIPYSTLKLDRARDGS